MDQLDPGLSKRPSRFDRKYLFDLPDTVSAITSCARAMLRLSQLQDERVLYCQFWRRKLESKPSIDFPEKLCEPIACITTGFSFAYLQEAFVATLLEIARQQSCSDKVTVASRDDKGDCPDDDDLNQYELWKVMRKQVKILRDDMNSSVPESRPESLADRRDVETRYPGTERAKVWHDASRPLPVIVGGDARMNTTQNHPARDSDTRSYNKMLAPSRSRWESGRVF